MRLSARFVVLGVEFNRHGNSGVSANVLLRVREGDGEIVLPVAEHEGRELLDRIGSTIELSFDDDSEAR